MSIKDVEIPTQGIRHRKQLWKFPMKNISGRKNKLYFCQKSGHQKKDCRKYQFWKAKKEKKNKAEDSDNKAYSN